jgi:hypothetical protein
MPTPPAWFVKSLRAINPHFGVRFCARRRTWEITEAVRTSKCVATLEGAPVFRIDRRPEGALRFKELGERCLAYVRRNDPRRYRSVEAMVESLGIDKGERPRIQETFV